MAIRGFEDWFAHLYDTHAGTASRTSQRLVCSETACRPDWIIVTIDVEKAFLQGVTYQEMQQLTGQPERFVYFSLPKGAAAVLRQLPGFEDFDERLECLRAMKPGTGMKDAPAAFSLKLARVTQSDECKLKPTTYDKQLELRHDAGGHAAASELVAMCAKHVDDIKIAGSREMIKSLLKPLEREFGKLAYSENEFLNNGIRHKRLADGSVQQDQDDYLSAMIPITHASLIGKDGDQEVEAAVSEKFRSLVGALAYGLITQFWIAVYVVALQRRLQAPKVIHVRRLNALVRILHKRPAKLIYRAMTCQRTLEVHSDSGFTKEQEKGYGIRGANTLRTGIDRASGKPVLAFAGIRVPKSQARHPLQL